MPHEPRKLLWDARDALEAGSDGRSCASIQTFTRLSGRDRGVIEPTRGVQEAG